MADESQGIESSSGARAPCEGGNQLPHGNAAHERDEKIRKRIGEALILVIYVVFDFRDEWPKNHVLALTLGAIAISSILLMELRWRNWALITMMLIVAAAIVLRVAPSVLPEETPTQGWLIPANEPTPPNGCASVTASGVAKADPLLIVGSVSFWVSGKSKFTALKVGSCPVISVVKETAGLLIDADDYDSEGNLSFRIRANEFHVMPQFIAYVDRSADRSAITVHDRSGAELLMVRFLNPNTVLIRGTFGCKGHDFVTISDNEIRDSQGILATSAGMCLGGDFTEAAIGIP